MKRLLLVLLIAGCAGTRTRENSLVPALRVANDGVELDIERGIADAVDDGELTGTAAEMLNERVDDFMLIIEEGSYVELIAAKSYWAEYRTWAERGIADRVEDGEWSRFVAESATERLDKFGEALAEVK